LTAFALFWTRRALRDMRSLDAVVKMRIQLRVEQARGDPLRFFEPLKGRSGFKLRAGDWRVVAEISLSERTIMVIAVDHRRNVYGR
jgi:mRNA interferase RelE/StbE